MKWFATGQIIDNQYAAEIKDREEIVEATRKQTKNKYITHRKKSIQ